MNPEEIAAILQKAIAGAIKPEEKNTENNNSEAIAGIAKAVKAISEKVDNLDKSVEKKTVETTDDKINKVASAVEALTAKIEEIQNPVNDEDKPIDLNKMTKKEFAEYISGIINPEINQKPKGKGKETQKTILNGTNDNDEIEVDLADVETTDVAGNPLSEEQRLARKNLDDVLGAKLTGVLQKQGLVEIEEADEDTQED